MTKEKEYFYLYFLIYRKLPREIKVENLAELRWLYASLSDYLEGQWLGQLLWVRPFYMKNA